jgi:hypothetical protein
MKQLRGTCDSAGTAVFTFAATGLSVGSKSKFVPVHAMKAYGGQYGITPLILNLRTMEVSGRLLSLASLPQQKPPLFTV